MESPGPRCVWKVFSLSTVWTSLSRLSVSSCSLKVGWNSSGKSSGPGLLFVGRLDCWFTFLISSFRFSVFTVQFWHVTCVQKCIHYFQSLVSRQCLGTYLTFLNLRGLLLSSYYVVQDGGGMERTVLQPPTQCQIILGRPQHGVGPRPSSLCSACC